MNDITYVTVSDMMGYLFCPRFVYYQNVMKISENEHRRALVNKGRDIHKLKLVQNKDYLRKKIGAVDKALDVYMASEKLRLVGKVDEVLFLSDGTAAPLDYKYAYWEDKIYKTHKYQQALYALLIMESFDIKVDRAFLVFIRSKNKLIGLPISQEIYDKAKIMLDEIFAIINMSYCPKASGSQRKCEDCAYRNLCSS